MNAPLARLALRLLGEAPWRMALLGLAVAATSGWLGVRTVASHAAIARATVEIDRWPAIVATTSDPAEATRFDAGALSALGATAGVRSAGASVECRLVDFAIDVGRAEETEVIAREVAQHLGAGWTVTTRARTRTATMAALERDAGRDVVAAGPIVLALLLLLLALGHGGADSRELVGKLKLVGFTTRQIAWLFGLRAAMPCLVGAAAGAALTAGAMAPGTAPWLRSLAGHDEPGAWRALVDASLAIAAFVLAPCIVAACLPAARLARSDPARLVEGG